MNSTRNDTISCCEATIISYKKIVYGLVVREKRDKLNRQ